MSPTRREFLAGALAAAGAVTIAGCSNDSSSDGGAASTTTRPKASPPESSIARVSELGDPARSGLDHIIVVMMENRSFDHYLGWLPGADGKQSGLTFVDQHGTSFDTHRLTDFQNCAHPDPDHSFDGGRIQLADGACDGFLRSGDNDEFAIGYYTNEDLPFTGKVASHWCALDRYFAATMAGTYPNRFYQHSAMTDRTHNSFDIAAMPTIWDRLAAKGVSARYYYSDVPFIALYGGKYTSISQPFDAFLQDAEKGTLPAVSFIDPKFTDEGAGTSADDHPHADIRAGQWFLDQVYRAVTLGPKWDKTLVVVNYDEWGGFYDHVAPAEAPDATPAAGTGLRGFRVPTMMFGPSVRRGTIGHETYDHTSILKMIEWRHDLASLTPRDKAARNLAEILDLSAKPDTDAPQWNVAAFDPTACPPEPEDEPATTTTTMSAPAAGSGEGASGPTRAGEDHYAEWRGIRTLADRHRFPGGFGF
ncbi:MAG TPA: alkaline phosphatase family protein [Acidimicrobiales bacterium]|nr:alkaline phosphatase family protein [Acidimicrobiales bacterium]